jgi:pimeloyl-ACP methyl ester carboxylesterase
MKNILNSINNILDHTLTLNNGTQYFDFAGARLAFDYQCINEVPTHLLVLVNGSQRTRLDFRAFRKKLGNLAPHVATLALDNRYCGETIFNSDKTDEFSIDMMAKDALALASIYMKKLQLNCFSVLGISMGGMIAQTLASLPVASIDRLFLVSTTAGGVGRTWSKPVSDVTQLKYENKNTDLESTKKNMSRYFAEKFLKNSPLLLEMMCKTMVKASSENTPAAAEHYRVSSQFDGVFTLNSLSAKKIVIISGNEDNIILVENSYYLHRRLVDSQLIIYPQVGHLILIEDSERFVQDIASFF